MISLYQYQHHYQGTQLKHTKKAIYVHNIQP